MKQFYITASPPITDI